ncbi:MAG: hypothetical protein Q9216_005099 [Gyalolechia sp. 2 TL-2023]
MPYFPCFQFISNRLAQSKLYVVFILSADEPFCIPAWPLSRASRSKVIRIFRRACQTYPKVPPWLASIASGSKDVHARALLEPRPSHAYLVRRSLLQHEIVFSGEGLALLTIDHVYTFKRCLLTLSETYGLESEYKIRMASCTRLLRRINTTYTGVKLSRSYLERAYGIDLRHPGLQKIHKAYLDSFGEPGVQDLAFMVEDETPCLPELESPCPPELESSYLAELESPYLPELESSYLPELESPCLSELQSPYLPELESPVNEAPMDIISAVNARPPTTGIVPYAQKMNMKPSEAWEGSVCSFYSDLGVDRVTYPKVPPLTKPPKFRPSTSRPLGCSDITTTICARCLINVEADNVARGNEMTMFLSPEWEDFRRIGLGILKP